MRADDPVGEGLALVGGAHADPAGKTTLQETLTPAPGSGYLGLQAARAENSVVRRGGSANSTHLG